MNIIDGIANGTVPETSAPAVTKLKQLTVVSLAQKRRRISYEILQKQLDLGEVRQLEDLLIECFYSGLIHGHLNQKEKVLELSHAVSRDIKMSNLGAMIRRVDAW